MFWQSCDLTWNLCNIASDAMIAFGFAAKIEKWEDIRWSTIQNGSWLNLAFDFDFGNGCRSISPRVSRLLFFLQVGLFLPKWFGDPTLQKQSHSGRFQLMLRLKGSWRVLCFYRFIANNASDLWLSGQLQWKNLVTCKKGVSCGLVHLWWTIMVSANSGTLNFVKICWTSNYEQVEKGFSRVKSAGKTDRQLVNLMWLTQFVFANLLKHLRNAKKNLAV